MFPRAWAKPGLLDPKDRASGCWYQSTKAVLSPYRKRSRDTPAPPNVVVLLLYVPPPPPFPPSQGPGSTLGLTDCSSPRVWLSQACRDAGGDTAGLEDSVKVSSKGSPVPTPVPPAGPSFLRCPQQSLYTLRLM